MLIWGPQGSTGRLSEGSCEEAVAAFWARGGSVSTDTLHRHHHHHHHHHTATTHCITPQLRHRQENTHTRARLSCIVQPDSPENTGGSLSRVVALRPVSIPTATC